MNNKKLLIALFALGSAGSMLAQVHNKGILKVNNNGVLYTKGVYNFGISSGKTSTTRSTNNGIVSLASAATAGVLSPTTNFVDGFVKLNPAGTLPAFYKSPVGSGTIYGPIGFNATLAQPIVNAFVRANPTSIGSTLEPIEVDKISQVEYWNVSSANAAKVTLYYSTTSDIATIVGTKPLSFLTVLGFDGTQWVAVNSEINSGSDFTSGSITSKSNVPLIGFTQFAIGLRKDLSCYPPVVYNGDASAKTWNGTDWSPAGAPTLGDKIIINAPLTVTSNIECYSVVMNADITMAAGKKLTVVNGFSTTNVSPALPGKIIMSNLASVLQQNPQADAPNIQMTRVVPQMRRYDFVFIANPIDDVTSFFSQIGSKNNVSVANSSGTPLYDTQTPAPASAFYIYRTYNADGLTSTAATPSNTPIGRGFSADVRNQAPYNPSITIVNGVQPWASQKEDIFIKIEGTTNNGSYQLPATDANGYSRLGNPYPSPIDIRTFWDINKDIVEETAYYWTYNTQRATLLGNSYSNSDFATFNRVGGVAASSTGPTPTFVPDGFILPLQSVLIRSKLTLPIIIDNCSRVSSVTPPAPPTYNEGGSNGKFRLNLTGSENTVSQILVSYDNVNGSLNVDNGYDSARLTGLGSELSTIIDNSRYVIQTRPGFSVEDVLPLQFDKRTDETFTISLVASEGVFTSTAILLHDKTLGIYHDLSVNGYSFVQTSAEDTQRFDVVYQNTTLGNSDFDAKNAFAFITKNQFRAQSNTTIAEIAIYDIAGRLVITYSGINEQGFSSNFDNAQGVYIAKIKLTDGTVVNQKVIQQ